jgi:hypothetical protein
MVEILWTAAIQDLPQSFLQDSVWCIQKVSSQFSRRENVSREIRHVKVLFIVTELCCLRSCYGEM